MGALSLARDVTETLNVEQQIWIINWLQQYLWSQNNDSRSINPKFPSAEEELE